MTWTYRENIKKSIVFYQIIFKVFESMYDCRLKNQYKYDPPAFDVERNKKKALQKWSFFQTFIFNHMF